MFNWCEKMPSAHTPPSSSFYLGRTLTVVLILVKHYFEWPNSIVAVFSLAMQILAEHTEKLELLCVFLRAKCPLPVSSVCIVHSSNNEVGGDQNKGREKTKRQVFGLIWTKPLPCLSKKMSFFYY